MLNDLRRLAYFVAVAEQASFNAAAKQCGISQAGLTKSIRALEESLQVKLFRRSPRGAELTRPGKVFMRHARLMLSQGQAAQLALRSELSGVGARLRVGVSSSWIVQAVMPEVLGAALESQSGIRVNLVSDVSSRQMIDDLKNGTLDVIIAAPNNLDDLEDIDSSPITHFTQGLVISSAHPLCGIARLSLDDLYDWDWICGPPGSYFRSYLDALYHANNVAPPTPRFVTTSHDLTLDLVAKSRLVGISIDKLIPLRHAGLVMMPESIFSIRRTISILTRKEDVLPSSAVSLIDMIKMRFSNIQT